jgi:hypothetical protein
MSIRNAYLSVCKREYYFIKLDPAAQVGSSCWFFIKGE